MKPYILVEPFCGMAALSFALMGCAPPISWMGSKRGYCRVLMELLGLSRHNPPAAFIWSDVGPNVAALATLAGARGDARDVAGWLLAIRWSFSEKGPEHGYGGPGCPVRTAPGGWTTEGRDKALSAERLAGLIDVPALSGAPEVAAIIRTWKDEEPRALWERLKAAGWPSLMLPKGMRWGQPVLGRWLGPCDVREVAGFLAFSVRDHHGGGSFAPPTRWNHDNRNGKGGYEQVRYLPDDPAPALDALPSRWPRVACYQGTATRMVEQLPGDLSGFVVYVDGPYHGDGSRKITGYKFGGCSREEQLAMAADCHRRGARVAMSESVPLAAELRALTGAEWWEVDITEHREGQSRTFGATREYVTLNAAPKHMRGTQQGLFGGAR